MEKWSNRASRTVGGPTENFSDVHADFHIFCLVAVIQVGLQCAFILTSHAFFKVLYIIIYLYLSNKSSCRFGAKAIFPAESCV